MTHCRKKRSVIEINQDLMRMRIMRVTEMRKSMTHPEPDAPRRRRYIS
jgi:hypothetical protein